MKRIPNIHPGDVLKNEFMEPLGISAYKLSKETGLSQTRIGQIIKKNRSITAETALKLGKFFEMTPQFWMNLQVMYDLEEAEKKHSKELKSIKTFK